MNIENKYINFPTNDHGLLLCDNQHHVIKNCVIDLTSHNLDIIDEAIGITWGCSADIENCVIRGAGKLVLCGCGDADKIPIEKGKTVTFKNCILEDFGRRGPEVQDGMIVHLEDCMIQNWGCKDRFSVRSFGAWAHTPDSKITAVNVIFKQNKMLTSFWKDMIAHIGQAINDEGILSVFTSKCWMPGNCRGLVASDKGSVSATHCYKNHWWIRIQNHKYPMNKSDAMILESQLLTMKDNLYTQFGIKK